MSSWQSWRCSTIQETKHQNSGHNGPRLYSVALCTWILQDNNHGNYYYAWVEYIRDRTNNYFGQHITYISHASFLVEHGNTLSKYQVGVKSIEPVFAPVHIFRASCGRLNPWETTRFPLVTKIRRDTTYTFSINLSQVHWRQITNKHTTFYGLTLTQSNFGKVPWGPEERCCIRVRTELQQMSLMLCWVSRETEQLN